MNVGFVKQKQIHIHIFLFFMFFLNSLSILFIFCFDHVAQVEDNINKLKKEVNDRVKKVKKWSKSKNLRLMEFMNKFGVRVVCYHLPPLSPPPHLPSSPSPLFFTPPLANS